MAAYDKFYKEKDYFGQPYEKLLEFFVQYPVKGTLLDLGCGQGRDSIPLAQIGYEVTGIDISKIGIAQMLNEALEQEVSMKLQGLIQDIYETDVSPYDIVLLNAVLHFTPRSTEREVALLHRICQDLKNGGILVHCLLKSKKKEIILKEAIAKTNVAFHILADQYVEYPEAGTSYHFYVLEKQEYRIKK